MNHAPRTIICSLVACLSVSSLFAQNHALKSNSDKNSQLVSVIALGPKPQRRYKMPDEEETGKLERKMSESLPKATASAPKAPKSRTGTAGRQAVMLSVSKYAAPPTQLFYKKSGARQKAKLSVRFNNQGGFSKLPSHKPIEFYNSSKKGAQLVFTLPSIKPDTSSLFFLTPTGKGNKLWEPKPKVTYIPLTWSENLETRVILLNPSRQVVQIHLSNGKKLALKPGSKQHVDLTPPNNGKRITLIAKGTKDRKIAIQDTIKVTQELTKVYAFYDANPKTNGGRSVGVYRAAYDAPKG